MQHHYIYAQVKVGVERLVETVEALPDEKPWETLRRAVDRAKELGLHWQTTWVNEVPPMKNKYWEGHSWNQTQA